jgi:hypothetical protein
LTWVFCVTTRTSSDHHQGCSCRHHRDDPGRHVLFGLRHLPRAMASARRQQGSRAAASAPPVGVPPRKGWRPSWACMPGLCRSAGLDPGRGWEELPRQSVRGATRYIRTRLAGPVPGACPAVLSPPAPAMSLPVASGARPTRRGRCRRLLVGRRDRSRARGRVRPRGRTPRGRIRAEARPRPAGRRRGGPP